MKVVLKTTHQNLGKKGEITDVAPGFARNFLIPQGIVLPANISNIAYIQNIVAQEKKTSREIIKKLKSLKSKIEGLGLEVEAKADPAGKLFGSVGKKEIQKALEEKLDVLVPIKKIALDKPIKKVGDYAVEINISSKLKPKIRVKVVRHKT